MIEVKALSSGYQIDTDCIQVQVVPTGYVSGTHAGSFLDKRTGARDLGWGLDIADFLLEPLWDDEPLDPARQPEPYTRNEAVHGRLPKRMVEGPQICTQAKVLPVDLIRGQGFVAVQQSWQWRTASYGRRPGSTWQQTLLFLDGQRYFLACDRITSVNAVDQLVFRTDLPGHIRHTRGDTFQQIYLSYAGYLPCEEFFRPFPPDGRFLYQRPVGPVPSRMIRAYQVRLGSGGGPWLAGMTLQPSSVWEAWCHSRPYNPDQPDDRTYVCMIQEIGGVAVQPGSGFSAAYVIGWFDSVADMEAVYDRYRGHTGLKVTAEGWEPT